MKELREVAVICKRRNCRIELITQKQVQDPLRIWYSDAEAAEPILASP